MALQVLSWTGLESEATRLMISGVAFVAFGLLCWKNGRDCGALHCRISGPGYLLLGGIAGVGALGWVPVELDWLMAAFVLIALGSYALEAGIGRREASRA